MVGRTACGQVNESVHAADLRPRLARNVDKRWIPQCGQAAQEVHEPRRVGQLPSPADFVSAVGCVEPKAPPEHRGERTYVRERGAEGGNARIGQSDGAQSRRRMTPINFPWIRTDG